MPGARGRGVEGLCGQEPSAAQDRCQRGLELPHPGSGPCGWPGDPVCSQHREAGFTKPCSSSQTGHVSEGSQTSPFLGQSHGSHPGLGLDAQVQKEGEQGDGSDGGAPGEDVCVGVIVGLIDSGVLCLRVTG